VDVSEVFFCSLFVISLSFVSFWEGPSGLVSVSLSSGFCCFWGLDFSFSAPVFSDLGLGGCCCCFSVVLFLFTFFPRGFVVVVVVVSQLF